MALCSAIDRKQDFKPPWLNIKEGLTGQAEIHPG